MKHLQQKTWMGCAILAGLVLACSGESALDELEPATPSDVSTEPSSSEDPLDMAALMRAEVTSEEMLVLEDFFARMSSGAPTSMQGRLLYWDDAMLTVDDVLWQAAHMADSPLVEKAYAQTAAANPNNSTSIQFWRPDIFFYYVIIEDNVASYVSTAVTQVLSEWTGLAVDCLGTSSFQVIRRSAYNALTQNQKDVAYEIDFLFIPKTSSSWTCPNGADGCASFPNVQSIKVGASFASRMAIGKKVTVDSTLFPSTQVTALKGMLRHEFGHTLGFDHQAINATSHHIPGTTICGINCFPNDQYPSVMRQGSAGGVFQPDDVKALRTLYANEANRANDDCAYVNNFRVLAQLP